jgi:2'-5' RNA ligase
VRLFVGVELSGEMKAAAADAADRLRTALERARLRVDARWVPAANLHVTLWFIGEVDETRAVTISEALSPPFDTPPFAVRAHGLGAFPSSGPPRVFWIGIREGAESLAALHAHVAARLAPLGFEAERRAYSAHITIARVKDVARGSAQAIRGILPTTSADAGAMVVSAATLLRSRVSSKGATYEPLLRIRLR